MRGRLQEYEICKVRGHMPDTRRGATINAIYGAVPKYVCAYCGTTYWMVTHSEQHESNAPEATKDTKGEQI